MPSQSIPPAALGLILICSLAHAQPRTSSTLPAEGVDEQIALLENDATRMAALDELIAFASMRLYSGSVIVVSGDPERDKLMDRARDAVIRHRDFETVRRAVNSPSETLQFWGLSSVPAFPNNRPAGDWDSLIPRMRELATPPSTMRRTAIERLRFFDGQREFLANLRKNETSIYIIAGPLGPDPSGSDGGLMSYFLKFLKHPEESVRRETLLYIGFNSNMAPMYHLDFPPEVLAEVLRLSHSPSDEERGSAVYALTDLRGKYPDDVRRRLLEMLADPQSDVRWRIPGGLKDQQDRADVQAALQKLLDDPSPMVRYFTISVLGPENHLDALKEIAAGPDKKAAEFASDLIKGVAQRAGNR